LLLSNKNMPQVSSQLVKKETLDEIHKLLSDAITNPDMPIKQRQACFDELLTTTEKIMLGKRLSAIALLSQGVSTYQTGKILRMSESTTNRIAFSIEKGELNHVIKLCEVCRMGPLGRYFKNLFHPLPRYGTSPSSLFKK
jgi:hypothetical protein